jgi:hypothetical protein
MMVVVGAVIVIIGVVLYQRKSKASHELIHDYAFDFEEQFNQMKANGQIAVDALERKPREIARATIKMLTVLGAGAFGEVWKGMIQEDGTGEYLVAIKTVKAGMNQMAEDELMAEAVVMAQVGEHHNVVSLHGVVTAGIGLPKMLLLSYCEYGSLQEVLRDRPKSAKQEPFTAADRFRMLTETVDGMAHLAVHFVHRDLAARNVLVSSAMVCTYSTFRCVLLSARVQTMILVPGSHFCSQH